MGTEGDRRGRYSPSAFNEATQGSLAAMSANGVTSVGRLLGLAVVYVRSRRRPDMRHRSAAPALDAVETIQQRDPLERFVRRLRFERRPTESLCRLPAVCLNSSLTLG